MLLFKALLLIGRPCSCTCRARLGVSQQLYMNHPHGRSLVPLSLSSYQQVPYKKERGQPKSATFSIISGFPFCWRLLPYKFDGLHEFVVHNAQ